jgi:hypothetical protein
VWGHLATWSELLPMTMVLMRQEPEVVVVAEVELP